MPSLRGGFLELTLDFHKHNFHFFGCFHFGPPMYWGYTMYSQYIGGLNWNPPKKLWTSSMSSNTSSYYKLCPHTFHRRRKYSTLQWDYKRRWKLRGFRNRRIARTEPASPIIALNCQSLRFCSLLGELLDSSKFTWISRGCNLNFSKQNQG